MQPTTSGQGRAARLFALAASVFLLSAAASFAVETNAPSAAAAAVAGGKPPAPNEKITLMIVGDSTAADYDEEMVVRGWGQYLPKEIPSRVTVLNRARPGRSARSYMEEGSWKDALKEKPDFVIIQFGHNDLREATNLGWKGAVRQFRKYLGGYIDTARKAGIQPILVTPTANRTFDAVGSKSEDQLTPFVEAIREVATLRGVSLIDVHAQCQELYNSLGKNKSLGLDSMANDTVHFNGLGAQAVAKLIAKDLTKIDNRFREHIPTPYELKAEQLGMSTAKK